MNINHVTRFATDRLDDLKKVGGAISNEVEYASKQLTSKAGDAIGGPVQAFTKAGVNPLAAVTQNKEELDKAFNHYRKNPNHLNELGLKSNMMMRYYSGIGAEGLQFPEGTGKQIFDDITESNKRWSDPETFKQSYTPDYIQQGVNKGNTPVYYGGWSDAVAPSKSRLPTDIGSRKDLSLSLGSYWAEPQKDGSYIINEDYNFGYAPKEKGGIDIHQGDKSFGLAVTPREIGRGLVRKGYGDPYSYQLQVFPDGKLNVIPKQTK